MSTSSSLHDRLVSFASRPTKVRAQDLNDAVDTLRTNLDAALEAASELLDALEVWLDDEADREQRATAKSEAQDAANNLAAHVVDIEEAL